MKMDLCLRDLTGSSVSPLFELFGKGTLWSGSATRGVVPRRAPNFLVERLRRRRCFGSTSFVVGGGVG